MASDKLTVGKAVVVSSATPPSVALSLQAGWKLLCTDNPARIAALEADLAKEKAENARMREAFNNAPANADFATMDDFAAAYDEWWETYVTPALAACAKGGQHV